MKKLLKITAILLLLVMIFQIVANAAVEVAQAENESERLTTIYNNRIRPAEDNLDEFIDIENLILTGSNDDPSAERNCVSVDTCFNGTSQSFVVLLDFDLPPDLWFPGNLCDIEDFLAVCSIGNEAWTPGVSTAPNDGAAATCRETTRRQNCAFANACFDGATQQLNCCYAD